MRHGRFRTAAALILIPALILFLAACAGAEEEGFALMSIEAGDDLINWRDLGLKKAEKLPVYSAPFEDAWRGANGKAAVSTKEPFRALGAAQNGEWTWIEYGTDGKNRRVGWIHAEYRPSEYDPNRFPADGAPLRITAETSMTDDPRGGRREILRLSPGDEVTGLGLVWTEEGSRSGWIYAETEIGGKPAWGFLPAGTAENIPVWTVSGDTLTWVDGVAAIGYSSAEEYVEDENGNYTTVWRRFGPGELRGGTVDRFTEAVPPETVRIVFPAGLKALGDEAVVYGTWKEIVMPDGPARCASSALYALSVDRIVFPKGYAGAAFFDDHCTFGAFEAAEGNPLYRTADGVLYSADGKTLVRYPNGRKDEHFDVPAGVEVIGRNAFADDGMNLPLKTVSLPAGLKKIEGRAFSGCGRLQSLTVPLTVTELDPEAFEGCVSLERLSLPPGLTASFNEDWAERGDFSVYNGDNGGTAAAPKPRDEYGAGPDEFSVRMMLIPKDGETEVPVYGSAESAEPSGFRAPGETVSIAMSRGNRLGCRDYAGYDETTWETIWEERWFDRENLTGEPGSTLFTAPEISFAADTWTTDAGTPAQPGRINWSEPDWAAGTVTFHLPRIADGLQYWGEESLTLAFADCVFRRTDGDPGRRLGVLYSGEGKYVLPLLEAPGGAEALRVPAGTQARAAESRDGWILAETAAGSGWIAEKHFAEAVYANAGE